MKLPLCRSDFLSDFTIELGRRLKNFPRVIRFNPLLDLNEVDQIELERLTIWVETDYESRIGFTLWEDGVVLVEIVALLNQSEDEYKIEFLPNISGCLMGEVIERYFDTIHLTNRFGFGESPINRLRAVWKHAGEVKLDGDLRSLSRLSNPE